MEKHRSKQKKEEQSNRTCTDLKFAPDTTAKSSTHLPHQLWFRSVRRLRKLNKLFREKMCAGIAFLALLSLNFTKDVLLPTQITTKIFLGKTVQSVLNTISLKECN